MRRLMRAGRKGSNPNVLMWQSGYAYPQGETPESKPALCRRYSTGHQQPRGKAIVCGTYRKALTGQWWACRSTRRAGAIGTTVAFPVGNAQWRYKTVSKCGCQSRRSPPAPQQMRPKPLRRNCGVDRGNSHPGRRWKPVTSTAQYPAASCTAPSA